MAFSGAICGNTFAAAARERLSLLDAVKKANFIEVKKILRTDFDISQLSEALTYAREHSYLDIADLLSIYEHNIPTDCKPLTERWLARSISEGDLGRAESLLKNLRVENLTSNGKKKAFLEAIKKEDPKMLHLLQKYGFTLTEEELENLDHPVIEDDEQRFLPRYKAFWRHYKEINRRFLKAIEANDLRHAEFYLKEGADVNGYEGLIPIPIALFHNNLSMVKFLVMRGAKVKPEFVQAINAGNVINFLKEREESNRTLLRAAQRGDLSRGDIEKLRNHEADLDYTDQEGFSILDHAISSQSPHLEDLKDIANPRRRYFKEVIGAPCARDVHGLCKSRERAFSHLQEKDPRFAHHVSHHSPSTVTFSRALDAAHKQNIVGEGTKILILEVESQDKYKHPDFQGIIMKDLMSAHAGTVTSVAYEMAPAITCEVASEAKIFQCTKQDLTHADADFCASIESNTIVNMSSEIGWVAESRTVEDYKRLIEMLLKHDNVLVLSIGNEEKQIFNPATNHNHRFINWLLEKYANKIIIAGGITAAYEDAAYVRPGSHQLLQRRFLCALAKGVPTRTMEGYWRVNGTSFAAPAISGAIALIKSKYPRLSLEEIMNILLESGEKRFPAGAPYSLELYGQGVLNVEQALALAEKNGHRT